ncbi:uncharacterized protein Z520_07181 [Fonsecaea multimorphosa CBS 102226]|uniref:Uncharacterized protein n=1 Tax=Fonsecaea multimorphosa CBS 102226 TaxID=1442371 RepID=A0A0D2JU97_9EURO|nr:uncharacterized protein Z520_07181 [Fonsecaea multimorphosa CBS 102226]KIX97067.1 hypothetical protein Z520_07181 [Fonsecaea multimorphosa CBS 102226]
MTNKGLLIVNKAATVGQVLLTVSSISQQAGFTTRLVSHNIRRGAAKDLARIPKKAIHTHTSSVARAIGHSDKSIGKYYNNDKDQALNILKPQIEISRIDQRLFQAPTTYPRPNRHKIHEMVQKELIAKGDEIIQNSTRGLQFFLGPRPGKNKDGFHKHRALPELPQTKRQKLSDYISISPTPLRSLGQSKQNVRNGTSSTSTSTSDKMSDIPIDPQLSLAIPIDDLDRDTLVQELDVEEIEELQLIKEHNVSESFWDLLNGPKTIEPRTTGDPDNDLASLSELHLALEDI